MDLISYQDLAKLRLADFLPEEEELDTEESGMTIIVGLGGYEALGESNFGWKQEEPYQTAEVTLDLSAESLLPEESAKRILKRLRLPVAKGMTADQLIAQFGAPDDDRPGRPGTRLLDFTAGDRDQYIIGCVVDEREGLNNIFLARKDYCDETEGL